MEAAAEACLSSELVRALGRGRGEPVNSGRRQKQIANNITENERGLALAEAVVPRKAGHAVDVGAGCRDFIECTEAADSA